MGRDRTPKAVTLGDQCWSTEGRRATGAQRSTLPMSAHHWRDAGNSAPPGHLACNEWPPRRRAERAAPRRVGVVLRQQRREDDPVRNFAGILGKPHSRVHYPPDRGHGDKSSGS